MAKIFCTKEIPQSGIRLLEETGHHVTINKVSDLSKQQLIKEAKNCQALLTMLTDDVDADFLEQCNHLKIISQFAVGYNNIDIAHAKAHGITVTNTPDVLTEATAELAFSLLLCVARKVIPAHKNANIGKWTGWEPLGFLGKSLHNSTVGIIGAGRIGCEFARMCRGAFKSDILYYSRSRKPAFEQRYDATQSQLQELVSQSDVISIHCPLNSATAKLFNESLFSHVKEGAIIINTARGEIVDQEALINAIKSQKLFGAGLDVTSPEPLPSTHELYNFENVVITPHIGSATLKAREEMSLLACTNIANVLQGKAPLTPVTV